MRLAAKLSSEVVEYEFDWASYLQEGESVASVSVAVVTGDVVVKNGAGQVGESDLSGSVQTIWFSGGSSGDNAIVLNAVVGGRTFGYRMFMRVIRG